MTLQKNFHPPAPGAHRAPLQCRRDGGEGTHSWVDASCLALSRFAAEICRRNTKHSFMTNKLLSLVAGIVIGGSATIFAQGGAKPANGGEGTVTVKGKSYQLKNAAAYETTIDGEDGIAVVLSGPTIDSLADQFSQVSGLP